MAKKRADYDPFEQAKPRNKEFPDFGTGRIHVLGTQYITREEFIELQTELEAKLNEQISISAQALTELQQIKMHLASMSDAVVEPGDGSE